VFAQITSLGKVMLTAPERSCARSVAPALLPESDIGLNRLLSILRCIASRVDSSPPRAVIRLWRASADSMQGRQNFKVVQVYMPKQLAGAVAIRRVPATALRAMGRCRLPAHRLQHRVK